LLRGDILFLRERLISLDVLARIGGLSPIPRQDGLSLIQGRLIWAGIELEEHLALLDLLTLPEGHPSQNPAHLGLDGHSLNWLDCARGRQLERHGSTFDSGDGDRHRRHWCRPLFGATGKDSEGNRDCPDTG
jgi:hypothetical protein